MRYLTGGRPTPYADVRDEILPNILARYEESDDFGRWAAIERSGEDFIGWFLLDMTKDRGPYEVELGYRLARSAWGKGYATEGSGALIEHAFRNLGVRRIFAQTMTVNTASRRVMEKCGLKFVRTFFEEWPEYIEGAEHGDVEYALERSEWGAGP